MAASGALDPGGQPDLDLDANEKRDAEIKAALAQGQELAKDGKYSKALRVVVDAVNLCPCDPAGNGKQRHGKDKSCNISQCMAALKSNDPDALYQVAKGPCTCGYPWPSCSIPTHAVALDALADCLFKAEQHTAALSTALATIRLDPTSAVGYCRGAKILRHLLKNASITQSKPAEARVVAHILSGDDRLPSILDLRRLLDRFVQVGLDITSRYRHKPKDSYNVVLQRMAYHMKCEIARRDPVKELPSEVLSMIFSLLDTTTLIRCLGVNKQWNQHITHDSRLWADLRLSRPGSPGRHFPAFLQKHQRDIKSLVIHDVSRFQLTTTKIHQILQGLPRLERLYLDSGKRYPNRSEIHLQLPRAPTPSSARLTQLSLVSFNLVKPVMQLLSFSRDTLTVLNLVNAGPFVSRQSAGTSNPFDAIRLAKLKKLRITQGDPTVPSGQLSWEDNIEMEPIVMATPNLEQFHLDGFLAYWRRDEPRIEKDGQWLSLRKLVLGSLRTPDDTTIDDWNTHFLPPLPSTMESIEMLNVSPEIAHNVMFTLKSSDPVTNDWAPPHEEYEARHFPNLEVFRCISGVLHHALLQRVLEPSARAGKLKVLELAATSAPGFYPRTPSAGSQLGSDFVPARDLRALASENLHTLGLHDFNFFDDTSNPHASIYAFCGDPFIDWLDCFPNLHTVAVYPGRWEGVAYFIAKLILHPKVKVIHQDYLRGVHWYEAQQLAKEHGVELRHTPNHLPVGWPMIED
ncbi:uncharacterized protein P884DRAFT_205071 [Thermothelomyces heterothallicus CBS 202.75]|uniref:uncharacterized protein n=1 Tax=Thermothelomyces heterothallicus CBS 202.75 TaxID=1149848 RepID=UPI003743965A